MLRTLFAIAFLAAGCTDDTRPPIDAPAPSCASLGCTSALCNPVGRCVCHGTACTFEPAPEVDPVCGEIAPEASPCCAFDLGCASGPPPECLPPAGYCWERACPLTSGQVAMPGVCS